jgi:hypothetical protein
MMLCLQGLSPIRACSLLTSIDGPKRAFVGATRALHRWRALPRRDDVRLHHTQSLPEADGLDLEERILKTDLASVSVSLSRHVGWWCGGTHTRLRLD